MIEQFCWIHIHFSPLVTFFYGELCYECKRFICISECFAGQLEESRTVFEGLTDCQKCNPFLDRQTDGLTGWPSRYDLLCNGVTTYGYIHSRANLGGLAKFITEPNSAKKRNFLRDVK